jgi:hypothetical protein
VNHVLTLGVQLLPSSQHCVAKRWHSQERGMLKLNPLSHSWVWTVITEKTARSRVCNQRQVSVIFIKQSVSSVSSVTAWMRLYFANMGTLALRLKGLTLLTDTFGRQFVYTLTVNRLLQLCVSFIYSMLCTTEQKFAFTQTKSPHINTIQFHTEINK